ncbi:MAG: hypothetical protein K2I30_04810 [Clostridia bacterium]|nr:hypothetical protein [Clostridia bacterium]
MNDNSKCKSCKYFEQYYLKENDAFKCADLGRCIRDRKPRGISCKPDASACAKWEQTEQIVEEQQTAIFVSADIIVSLIQKVIDVLSSDD